MCPLSILPNDFPAADNHLRMRLETDIDDPTDRALLERAAAGDAEAFGAIYSRHQKVVYRFAYAMTRSPDVAADIVQEVFTTLLRDLGRYDSTRSALTTYLYGIARNLSRERERRERRFDALDAAALCPVPEKPFDDPVERLAGAQAAARMQRAFGTLPRRYREVIVLCDLHDLPYAEAADVLRTSIGAVRWRLHRGRHMLRTRLRQLDASAAGRLPGTARYAI
jgi:RNA polymerase sigma-70 factor, ECF subfamily